MGSVIAVLTDYISKAVIFVDVLGDMIKNTLIDVACSIECWWNIFCRTVHYISFRIRSSCVASCVLYQLLNCRKDVALRTRCWLFGWGALLGRWAGVAWSIEISFSKLSSKIVILCNVKSKLEMVQLFLKGALVMASLALVWMWFRLLAVDRDRHMRLDEISISSTQTYWPVFVFYMRSLCVFYVLVCMSDSHFRLWRPIFASTSRAESCWKAVGWFCRKEPGSLRVKHRPKRSRLRKLVYFSTVRTWASHRTDSNLLVLKNVLKQSGHYFLL